jgi:hypothetical protein
MEYKRLTNLQNTYPETGNYISDQYSTLSRTSGLLQYESNEAQEKAKINLFGKYPDKNVLPFTTKTLKNLNYVEGTNFRFILAIFKDYNDTFPIYYTSQAYYNDLNSALIEGNPYFLQASFDSRNIISFVYEDAVNIVKKMEPLEQLSRIDFRTNIFVIGNSFEITYENVVRYIDWLVDKPSPVDDENFGVLHAETIAGWNALNGNFATGEVQNSISASYGIGKEFVIIESAVTETDLSKIQKTLDEKIAKENEVKRKIDFLNEEIRTQQNYKFPLGKSAYAEIQKKIYSSGETLAQALLGPRSARAARITSVIVSDITSLNYDLNDRKIEVANAQAELNVAKKTIEDAMDKAKKAKELAEKAFKDLNGKIPSIPKIPKLPAIPKIPKLPSVSDVLALIPIPALPVLPKLPALPKFGRPKLPKVPKIKLKKPKEPKKVKKNKGKGLKGALSGLQDAANQAQSAAAAASAAAAGAVAGVTNLANQAKATVSAAQSAVANAQSAVQGAVANAQSAVQGAVANAQSAAKGAIADIEKAAEDAIKSIPKPKI